MQTFIDTATEQPYAFDDDVVATDENGVYLFHTAGGATLTTPSTLQPYVPPTPPAVNPAAVAWIALQGEAHTALEDSDLTVLRCAENGIAVPAAWATYRKALRAIVGAASGDATEGLPAKPSYPAGT